VATLNIFRASLTPRYLTKYLALGHLKLIIILLQGIKRKKNQSTKVQRKIEIKIVSILLELSRNINQKNKKIKKTSRIILLPIINSVKNILLTFTVT